MRNPLTAIKAYVHLLNRAAKKDNDNGLADKMSKIDNQVQRMENLISGFLDAARLGEGKINLKKSHFDMADLVKRTEQECMTMITSHRLIFAPAEIAVVEADRSKIEQVMTNFINNAVKYSLYDTCITVNCFTKDGFAYFSVKDQGMGIPAKDHPFIFDRFYRVESDAMKNTKGFGMGLYICKEIIERHHGQIGMESTEGSGSTFWFRLPVAIS
ncbi:sensor histidine kinase [Chryseobacterium viscerum]|uniref:sensor histidine kinase n=1 Tax=Chryseobacterium viscerum TaxID=1037377 RepID=UPI0014031F52|nr:HAMP domain-containing sensor histidine kinase [Chryseobacterium viscerum]